MTILHVFFRVIDWNKSVHVRKRIIKKQTYIHFSKNHGIIVGPFDNNLLTKDGNIVSLADAWKVYI